MAEHEVEDAGVEVGRIAGRCADEVDLLERCDAAGDALRGVGRSEIIDVEHG